MIRSFNPGVEVNVDPCAPATRFWLLAFGLAAVTAVLGVIVLAVGSDALATAKQSHEAIWKVLWGLIKPRDGEKINRALGHVVMGSTIVVVPVILARWRSCAAAKIFLWIFYVDSYGGGGGADLAWVFVAAGYAGWADQ